MEITELQTAAVKAADGNCDAAQYLITWIQQLLETQLKGNRTVSAQTWAVIKAMTRAFPLLLHKALDDAQALAETDTGAATSVWIGKAINEGLLGPFLMKLPTQPQIVSAYASSAPIRDKELVQKVHAVLEPLKGKLQIEPTMHSPKATNEPTMSATDDAAPHIETEEQALQRRLDAQKQKAAGRLFHRRSKSAQADESSQSQTHLALQPQSTTDVSGIPAAAAELVQPVSVPSGPSEAVRSQPATASTLQPGHASSGTAASAANAAAAALSAAQYAFQGMQAMLPLWRRSSTPTHQPPAANVQAASSASFGPVKLTLSHNLDSPDQPFTVCITTVADNQGPQLATNNKQSRARSAAKPRSRSASPSTLLMQPMPEISAHQTSSAAVAPHSGSQQLTSNTSNATTLADHRGTTISTPADTEQTVTPAIGQPVAESKQAASSLTSWMYDSATTAAAKLTEASTWLPAMPSMPSISTLPNLPLPAMPVLALPLPSITSITGASKAEMPAGEAKQDTLEGLSDDEHTLDLLEDMRQVLTGAEDCWDQSQSPMQVHHASNQHASHNQIMIPPQPENDTMPSVDPAGHHRNAHEYSLPVHTGRAMHQAECLQPVMLSSASVHSTTLTDTPDSSIDASTAPYAAAQPGDLQHSPHLATSSHSSQLALSSLAVSVEDVQSSVVQADTGLLDTGSQQLSSSVGASLLLSQSLNAGSHQSACTVPSTATATAADGSTPGSQPNIACSQQNSVGSQPNTAGSQPNTAGSSNSRQLQRSDSELSTSIKLHLQPHSVIPTQQLVARQAGLCAGCRAPLPLSESPKGGRWGSSAAAKGPQLCDYTGRLYCHDCHRGHVSIIPARVLHNWDFAAQPVCQAAQDYLASIHSQPLLCVAAVNPALFGRVEALSHADTVRRFIIKHLAAAEAAGAEARVQSLRAFAGRQRMHILTEPDFWSLSDLLEISKGPSSQLLRWLEAIERQASGMLTAPSTS